MLLVNCLFFNFILEKFMLKFQLKQVLYVDIILMLWIYPLTSNKHKK